MAYLRSTGQIFIRHSRLSDFELEIKLSNYFSPVNFQLQKFKKVCERMPIPCPNISKIGFGEWKNVSLYV